MKEINAALITKTVEGLCIEANRILPEDVRRRIGECRKNETWPAARDILDKIAENAEIARSDAMPICQDTGAACVFLEIGTDVHISGDLSAAVNEGVRLGYKKGFLRNSMVRDPLRRENTGDNTPAMLYVDLVPGDEFRITVAPKGFGSENMSRIQMLKPSDGIEGMIDFVVSSVEAAGSNPCPPIIAGVGIGGTFDKAALLAKKALLRPLDSPNGDPFYAELEARLLEAINQLGIGPQGFGGRTTALAVTVEAMPTHIAGFPCAVNINCHASRHAEATL